MSENRIVLKTVEDSIITPHVKPVRAADRNVKLYKILTESSQLNIQITQSNCTNAMSGMVSPYTVTVEFKKNTESSFHKFEGCGHYATDYRLQDIWVLEELNGKKVDKADFSKEFPSMELNATTNTFAGFAGCNRMKGKLFFEEGLLLFADIVTTKMMCEPNNKETAFLNALRSTTTYKIGNNRLWLSNSSGELLTFKK